MKLEMKIGLSPKKIPESDSDCGTERSLPRAQAVAAAEGLTGMPGVANCSSLIHLAAYGGGDHGRDTISGIRFIHRVHSFSHRFLEFEDSCVYA